MGKSLAVFFKTGVFRPFYFLIRLFLRPAILVSYKIYFWLKKGFKNLNLPIKNKILYPLTTRYVIHFFIIILTILVATNNLSAREVKLEEFGQKTLFSEIFEEGGSQEIVEGIETVSPNRQYQNLTGFAKAKPVLYPEVEIDTEIATTEEGTTLVKATLPSTTESGKPREKIEEYQIQGGDTISTIASKFGITTNTILWANNLSATSLIKPGQTITIPPVSGVLYTVAKGDNLEKIANKYKADENKILEFNQLADPAAIEVDQQIMIPGGQIEPPPPPKPTTTRFASTYSGNIPPSARVPAGSRLLWPTVGRKINQYFTWRHKGIDIEGNYNTPVYVAESGTVEKTSWGRGYGNVIFVNHGGGKKTIYAHLSKSFVRPGQAVSKGDTIGMQGCTGWCTGTHLHFEVMMNGVKYNPLSYL